MPNIMNEPAPDLDVYRKVFGKWYTPILNPFEVKEFCGHLDDLCPQSGVVVGCFEGSKTRS